MYPVSSPARLRLRLTRSLAYVLSATLSGAITGGGLALVGQALGRDGRAVVAAAGAAGAIVVGGSELAGVRVPLPQLDRETPPPWTVRHALAWAIRNGALLGTGAWSRIGFWLWFVVPVGALISGDAIRGAGLYGAYGLARSGSVWLVALGQQRGVGKGSIDLWLVGRAEALRRPAALLLLADGIALAIRLAIAPEP